MYWNPLFGASCLLRGMALLARKPLRPFVMVPLSINVLLFGFGTLWFYSYYRNTVQSIDHWIPSWMHWINWIQWIEWLLLPVFFATVLLVVSLTFTMAANLISAPFNGLLAEKVEQLVTGQPVPATIEGYATLLRHLFHDLQHEFRKLLRVAMWLLLLWLLSFIPGVNILSAIIGLMLAGWLLAAEYLDFPMGNHGIPAAEIGRFMRSEPILVLGFGMSALATIMMPGLNLLAVPASVAGATLLWVEHFRKSQVSLSNVTERDSSSSATKETGYRPEKQASQ
ncbi:MAG: sulfate transporter CysZ [Magnetococcales bacterium]|nr:sulfate transporter CysZ [Magnetococcales bacterium]